VTFDN